MHFVLSAASAVVALAASACAQTLGFASISSPTSVDKIQVGTNLEIRWQCPAEHAARNVRLVLIGGEEQRTQVELADVTTAPVPCSAGQFSWPVPKTIAADKVHGLKIIDATNPEIMQYSQPFQIVGGPSPSLASASAVTSDVSSAAPTAAVPTDVATEESAPQESTAQYSAPQTTVVPSSAPKATGKPHCIIAKNATIPAVQPPKAAGAVANAAEPAGAGSSAVAVANVGYAGGAPNRASNSTGTSIPMTAGASSAHAGLLSVFGGVVALGLAL